MTTSTSKSVPSVSTARSFDQVTFDAWLKKCQYLVDTNNAQYSHSPKELLEATYGGQRFVKVICQRYEGEQKAKYGGRVYAFVELATGDIFKPASYKAPAKHPRGNIYAEDGGMGCMSHYGPAYLR